MQLSNKDTSSLRLICPVQENLRIPKTHWNWCLYCLTRDARSKTCCSASDAKINHILLFLNNLLNIKQFLYQFNYIILFSRPLQKSQHKPVPANSSYLFKPLLNILKILYSSNRYHNIKIPILERQLFSRRKNIFYFVFLPGLSKQFRSRISAISYAIPGLCCKPSPASNV